MAEYYTGEIRMFAAARTQAPDGWHFCDGSMMPVAQYQALFALIGTTYGGDGITTFALPDFRSRLAVSIGAEPHTSTVYAIGARGGLEQVQLTAANMPAHTHQWMVNTLNATVTTAQNNMFGSVPLQTIGTTQGGGLYDDVTTTGFTMYSMDGSVIGAAGTAGASHENRMPLIAIAFIIALNGLYPVRSN